MQNYVSIYFNICIFVQQTGRQKILHQTYSESSLGTVWLTFSWKCFGFARFILKYLKCYTFQKNSLTFVTEYRQRNLFAVIPFLFYFNIRHAMVGKSVANFLRSTSTGIRVGLNVVRAKKKLIPVSKILFMYLFLVFNIISSISDYWASNCRIVNNELQRMLKVVDGA